MDGLQKKTDGRNTTTRSKSLTKCAISFTAKEICDILKQCHGNIEIRVGTFHLKYHCQGPGGAESPSQVPGVAVTSDPVLDLRNELSLIEAEQDNLLIESPGHYEQEMLDRHLGNINGQTEI